MPRATTALLNMATTVTLLASCGTADDLTSVPTTGETTTSQELPSDAPTTDIPADTPTAGVPPFPETPNRQTAEPSGEWDLVFTDVRVAAHEGFHRIVLEFKGAGVPGWTVNYVDEAKLDGSGKAVQVDGDAFLDIYAANTTWPASGYYNGPAHFKPENGGNVNDVRVGGTFEGYTQVLAGIAGKPVPFRVFALADPSRLVVDVVDDSAG